MVTLGTVGRSLRQEALMRAYVRAVVAQAGMSAFEPEPDYGTDLCVRAIVDHDGAADDAGLQLDFQLRSTTRATVGPNGLTYELDADTYRKLRLQISVPRYLVVLDLPGEETQWLEQTPDALILRRCAYWYSLSGEPERDNASTVTIAIPAGNVFSANWLRATMHALLQSFTQGPSK